MTFLYLTTTARRTCNFRLENAENIKLSSQKSVCIAMTLKWTLVRVLFQTTANWLLSRADFSFLYSFYKPVFCSNELLRLSFLHLSRTSVLFALDFVWNFVAYSCLPFHFFIWIIIEKLPIYEQKIMRLRSSSFCKPAFFLTLLER